VRLTSKVAHEWKESRILPPTPSPWHHSWRSKAAAWIVCLCSPHVIWIVKQTIYPRFISCFNNMVTLTETFTGAKARFVCHNLPTLHSSGRKQHVPWYASRSRSFSLARSSAPINVFNASRDCFVQMSLCCRQIPFAAFRAIVDRWSDTLNYFWNERWDAMMGLWQCWRRSETWRRERSQASFSWRNGRMQSKHGTNSGERKSKS
jgi:hypothetical protein